MFLSTKKWYYNDLDLTKNISLSGQENVFPNQEDNNQDHGYDPNRKFSWWR